MTAEATAQALPATDFLATVPDADAAGSLAKLRRAGAAHFDQVGLPTIRDEAWRFTNLRKLRATTFFTPDGEPGPVDRQRLSEIAVPAVGGTTIVTIDGRPSPSLSTPGDPVEGLTIMPLLQAAADNDRRLLDQIGRHVTADESAFAALNAASFRHGTFIHVARGTAVAEPIVLLHVSTATDRPWMTHPRNLIVCEDAAKVTVLEHHVTLTGRPCLTNVVTEIVAGAGASAYHYRIEEEGDESFHVATLGVHQGPESHVESHCVLFGGTMARNNVHPVLDGKGGHCLLNGLYVGNGQQQLDNHMRVDHVQPGCESRQFYRGVLDDHASGVFCGRIHVTSAAQQTDAKQSNASLLLSEDASNHSRPQLEIYADDVKCTHGATVGQIDDDAIFYLRARGIRPESARAMMVYAHAAECFERMAVEPLREMLKRRLVQKMPWRQGR